MWPELEILSPPSALAKLVGFVIVAATIPTMLFISISLHLNTVAIAAGRSGFGHVTFSLLQFH